jgi:hypothetical protein
MVGIFTSTSGIPVALAAGCLPRIWRNSHGGLLELTQAMCGSKDSNKKISTANTQTAALIGLAVFYLPGFLVRTRKGNSP